MNLSLHHAPRWLMFWLMRRRQALLVAMLVFLHLAIAEGIDMPWGRILMLPHLALFLVWQPFINAQSTVSNRQLLVMALVLATSAIWFSWPMMSLWLIFLAGMVGGRVFFYYRRLTKLFYLIALIYLMAILLLSVIPQLVPGSLVEVTLIGPLVKFGLPGLIVIMAALPESREQDAAREAIDLAYSFSLMMMLAVMTLGSIALMLLQHVDYIKALIITVFAMATMLLATSWLWNPGSGISGLSAVASRYMLSIGLPFEQWLRSLAELAQQEPDPDRFLDRACQGMVAQLPWLSSCTWSDGVSSSQPPATPNEGRSQQTVFRQGELVLTLTTQQAIAPMMVWHFNLVTQLVARFHAEKKRDRQLREMAYMQAVHETGARVTHDVKNLLQSLNALLFVIGDSDEASIARAQPLLRRQLPLIAQRLQQTLEKLHAPDTDMKAMMVAETWWNALRNRYESPLVHFEALGNLRKSLPETLFTNAVENLLQNAFDKRAGEAGIDIRVTLDMREQAILNVSDNGSPVPEAKVAELGRRPMVSDNGLGIALYQVARLAAMADYELALSANRMGEVCFRLAPIPPA